MFEIDINEMPYRPEALDKLDAAEDRFKDESEFLLSLKDLGCKTAHELLTLIAVKNHTSLTDKDYFNFTIDKQEMQIKGKFFYSISMPFVPSSAVSFKLISE